MFSRLSARSASLCALAAAVTVVVGCGGNGQLKVYAVTGQVLYNGEPLPKVDVAFHPTDPKNNTGYPPHATTDENGKFTLMTYVKDDGAPAGEYQVAVAFAVEVAGGDDGADQAKKLTFQVPAKYQKKETSGLTATIKPETNVLEPFKLEGPPRPKRKS